MITTPQKTFDCVEMMHEGAERIGKITEGMTLEQELAYWQERHQVLVRYQAAIREAIAQGKPMPNAEEYYQTSI